MTTRPNEKDGYAAVRTNSEAETEQVEHCSSKARPPAASLFEEVDIDGDKPSLTEEFSVMDVVQERAKRISEPEDDPSTAQPKPRTTAGTTQLRATTSQPGAFLSAPATVPQRLDNIPYSLVGATSTSSGDPLSQELFHDETNSDELQPIASSGQDNISIPYGLAEAKPVQEEKLPNTKAKPFDVQKASRRKELEKATRRRYLVILAVFGIVLIAVVLLGLALRSKNHRGAESDPSSSSAPSVAPSQAPSSAPTGALDLLLQDLPASTRKSLGNSSSPQWKAQEWLSAHPELPSMEEWRKRQLFALATFFHAMEGPHWPKDFQENWLHYSKHECFWFSSEFGLFTDDGRYEQLISYNVTPCNAQEELQLVGLAGLQLSNYKPYLPPELSLLTALSILALPTNGINASMTEFLPTELYEMANLTTINLHTNTLSGSLPSQIGLMTSLSELVLYSNLITGTLPSTLQSMSQLGRLLLYRNSLVGPIPTQLGLTTNLAYLALHDNTLSETIPSQLGELTSLAWLYLQNNNLIGSLPTQMGRLTNMVQLGLDRNSLNASLPSEMGLMSQLGLVHLYSNQLMHSIPTEWGGMTSLQHLGLDDNLLEGRIPTEFGLMTNLQELAMFHSALTGPLPSELGRATDLYFLSVQQNRLSNALPSQLGLLTHLQYLDLENNTMTSIVPPELAQLVVNGSLATAIFQHNNFSGIMPDGLCSMGTLDWNTGLGLSFDCNEQLCGCQWCACGVNGGT